VSQPLRAVAMARFAKLPSPPSVARTVPPVVWRGVQLIQSCSCRSIVNRSRHRVTQRFTFHWSRSRSVPRVAGTREPSHGDCTQWLAHFDSFRSNAFSFGTRLASGWIRQPPDRYQQSGAAGPVPETLPRTNRFPNGSSRMQSALTLQFYERYPNFRRT
jgi:hypothetical protein